MSVYVNGSTIYLYGDVGDFGGSESFNPSDVLQALRLTGGGDVRVSINSGGGFVFDGIAIYNSLRSHPGKISVDIDGVAASAASLIAMAGAEIVMRSGSMMMIHDPSWSSGVPDERMKDVGERQAEQMAEIYARRTKKTATAMRALMKAETWLTDKEAVAAGLADRIEGTPAKLAAKFDYGRYDHAPAPLMSRKPLSLAATMRKQFGLSDETSKKATPASEPEPITMRVMRKMIAAKSP